MSRRLVPPLVWGVGVRRGISLVSGRWAGLRPGLRAFVAAGLALTVLVSAVNLGAGIPGLEFLNPFRADRSLDYGAWPFGEFAPLRAPFVADVLGTESPSGAAAASNRTQVVPSSPLPMARVVLEHAPTNDDFANAVDVASVPFTAKTDTATASRETDEPSGCGVPGGTLWYRYRARASLPLVANTIGTGSATSLGVFEGTRVGALSSRGCATDARGNAQVAFSAASDKTYYFQVNAPLIRGPLVFNLELQGITRLLSLASSGKQADRGATGSMLGDTGRFVAFDSEATNLGGPRRRPHDWLPLTEEACTATTDLKQSGAAGWPCRSNMYLRDRAQGTTVPIPAYSSYGGPGGFDHGGVLPGVADLTPDGRYILFQISAYCCEPEDAETTQEVLVYDRVGRRFDWISAPLSGHRDWLSVPVADYLRSGHPGWWVEATDISPDGRFVNFTSIYDDNIRGDTNDNYDVFRWDRTTRTTTLISVSSSGKQGNGWSKSADGTPDGRYVVFRSAASNLVPGDRNGGPDIFRRDMRTGTMIRVSVNSKGKEADGSSSVPSTGGWQHKVSDDGRFVLFPSEASNLVPGDSNGVDDLFVRDVVAGTTTRVNVSSSGEQADAGEAVDSVTTYRALTPTESTIAGYSISPNGRYVVFSSTSTNLVPDDENGSADVFVRDLLRGTTTRVSVSTTGAEGNANSIAPRISADGRIISFTSSATNLVRGDTNGYPDVFTYERPPGFDL